MLEVISQQIVVCLIITALIGGVIGYFIGKNSCKKKYSLKEKTNNILYMDKQDNRNNNQPTTKTLGSVPILLSEARDGEKDNLQRIKGVGVVLEKVLNETGIYHFDQIANLSQEEITWLDKLIAFPGRIQREKWINQAKDLAKSKNS